MTDVVSAGARRRKGILAVAAVAVLAALWVAKRRQECRLYRDAEAENKARAEAPVQVKAYKVRRRDVSGALSRIGTVKARAETNLQFGAPGRLAKFDAEKGAFVKKGAVVAVLDQEEAKNAMAAAEAEYQKAAVKYFKDRLIDKLEFERVKARYNQARLDAGKTVVRAPHDGYLVEKWLNAGEQAEAGAAIGKLMDKSRVSVEMDLSEDDIQHLKTGQTVTVTVDAVPGYKAEGRVASVIPYLKGDTRSFSVKVELPENPGEKLSPGMFARCSVRRYEKAAALVVPIEAAAEMRPKEIRLFVVGGDNKVAARVLPVLFTDDVVAEVEGVAEEELVVLHPGTDLAEGAKVRVVAVHDPAAAEPPSPPAGSSGP